MQKTFLPESTTRVHDKQTLACKTVAATGDIGFGCKMPVHPPREHPRVSKYPHPCQLVQPQRVFILSSDKIKRGIHLVRQRSQVPLSLDGNGCVISIYSIVHSYAASKTLLACSLRHKKCVEQISLLAGARRS